MMARELTIINHHDTVQEVEYMPILLDLDFYGVLKAGLFANKIRICYTCSPSGGLQRRYLALTRSSWFVEVHVRTRTSSCYML
jgi:hypothetical protein